MQYISTKWNFMIMKWNFILQNKDNIIRCSWQKQLKKNFLIFLIIHVYNYYLKFAKFCAIAKKKKYHKVYFGNNKDYSSRIQEIQKLT